MQKTLLALLLSSAVVYPVASHAEGNYVKLGVGQSRYSGDKDATPTGYYLAYGAQIDPSLDVEFGYIDFGRANIGVNYQDVSGTVRTKTSTVYGAAIGNVPMSPVVNLQGKLGVAVNRSTATTASADLLLQDYPESPTRTNIRALIGAGLTMRFNKELSGALEYTYFGTAAHGEKLSLLNAALSYHF